VEFGGQEDQLIESSVAVATGDRYEATLRGLDAGSRYYFRILARAPSLGVYLGAAAAATLDDAQPTATAIQSFQTPPSAFHVKPYLQHPTPTAITIRWETPRPATGQVEFGETPDLGRTVPHHGALRQHDVRLEGLTPGQRYFYRVRTGNAVSGIYTFRAAPEPGTNRWKLALYGDSRTFPSVHRQVVEQIRKHDVDLVLHTGDMVDNGRVYEQWRRQFFAPIAPLAANVPYVTALGNHEGNSQHYFDYFTHPGNERFFALPFANARIICLDSNSVAIKDGRDAEQFKWLSEELKRPTTATWTFVAFHHPIFSAHASRSINPLRWDWAPLLCEAGVAIDAILTGHDHFYARSFPISTITGKPVRGIPSYTSAGGGAWPYNCTEFDYIAFARTVYHFTLMEFEGDRVTVSVITHTGQVLDRHVLTKDPTPPDQLCAYEIEELKERLQRAIRARPIRLNSSGVTKIEATLQVPHLFQVPLKGTMRWTGVPGWSSLPAEAPFDLKPNEPLEIPLRAEVQAGSRGETPKLTIEFQAGLFRNRIIEVQPFAAR
jgi:hypothetical protein